ncbi:MAG: glycosyltransferase [Syntrophaceae bacterium]|nr:glycosyltransferase [Syntrophaceae bacterium]
MKIAIIHDWLTGMRGGEKCLEVFCGLFPDAHLFTLLYAPDSVSPTISRMNIHTSFLQHLPFIQKMYRFYLPLYPSAVEALNVKEYRLILSISHCAAKGVIPSPQALHIAYLLTPMRYAWDMYPDYFGDGHRRRLLGPLVPFLANYLRLWDVASNHRVDDFICISDHVARRIRRYYQREARVIHPPADMSRFFISRQREDYFLAVSSLVPYKRLDLAVFAFKAMKKRLVVIGKGPEEKRLKSMADANIEFLGWQPDEVVAEYYSKCQALVFPGEEDFGIVPLEAMASGRPVIAYARGGVLETVVPLGEKNPGDPNPGTGVFFHEPTAEALIQAVKTFEARKAEFDPGKIRDHARQWDLPIFREKMRSCLRGILANHGEEWPC